jgi:hypothetical protein
MEDRSNPSQMQNAAPLNDRAALKQGGVYEGRGHFFSEELQRAVHGTFSVTWDNIGECVIACTLGNVDLFTLMMIMGEARGFRDLVVETESGTFVAKEIFQQTAEFTFGVDKAPALDLCFTTLAAEFVPNISGEPAYWSTPLVNFLSQFPRCAEGFEHHPLDSSAGDPKLRDIDGELERLIAFTWSGQPAFIKPLPQYEDAKRALQSGTAVMLATASIVGSVPPAKRQELEAVRDWFPTEVLDSLSLATGVHVGIGPVEIWTADRQLLRRVHLAVMNRPFAQGHVAIYDQIHGGSPGSGTGPLTEGLCSASEEQKQLVRQLVDNLENTQLVLDNSDHAFAYMVRAFDGLANRLGLNRKRLYDEVPPGSVDEIKKALFNARDSIKAIEATYRDTGQIRIADVVARIASRTEQAHCIDDSFGIAVSATLVHYGFTDEAAINDLYSSSPRADNLRWSQVLSKYRRGVIHRGFLDYSANVEILDVFYYTKHLMDVALRVIFKEIGYHGSYNPCNLTATQSVPADQLMTVAGARLFAFDGNEPKPIQKRIVKRSDGGPHEPLGPVQDSPDGLQTGIALAAPVSDS